MHNHANIPSRIASALLCMALACGIGCKDRPEIPPLPPETETQPALPQSAIEPRATLPLAPHEGRLIPIPDVPGHVEMLWDGDTGELWLYFVDDAGRQLPGVKSPSLWISTAQGPLELRPESCGDTAWSEACIQTSLPQGSEPRELTCILRFELDNSYRRVLLPTLRIAAEPSPQPAEAPSTTQP